MNRVYLLSPLESEIKILVHVHVLKYMYSMLLKQNNILWLVLNVGCALQDQYGLIIKFIGYFCMHLQWILCKLDLPV